MNCRQCGYSMTGVPQGNPCPECACPLPPVSLQSLRTTEKFAFAEVAAFVALMAFVHSLIIINYPPLMLLFPLIQIIAALLIATHVATVSAGRRFWTSRMSRVAIGLGAFTTMMLAPFAIANLIVIAWVAIR